MALNGTIRQPDIIMRNTIPLEATNDMPLAPLPEPPTNATNDPTEIAAGAAREITGEELAVGERARRPREPAEPARRAANDEPTGGERAAGEQGGGEEPAGGEQPAGGEEPGTGDDPDAPTDPNLPPYAIREITKTRRSARQRIAAAEQAAQRAQQAAEDGAAAIEAMRARIAEFEAQQPQPEPPKPDPRPSRYDFDDPDAYDEAIAAWGQREGIRIAEARAAEEAAAAKKKADDEQAAAEQKTRDEALARLDLSWREARMAAMERYSDYEAVAEADPADGGPTISDTMAAVIVQLDNGPDVAYYLGQNPEESVRIANMPNVFMQATALGRVAERLNTMSRAPRRRAAENPIEPIDTHTNRVEDNDREPTIEELAEKHRIKNQENYRPFFPRTDMH